MKQINTEIILGSLIELLLLFILVSPTVLQPIKFLILVLCILLIFIDKKNFKKRISKKVCLWIILYLTTNLLFLFKGTSNNTTVMFQLLPNLVLIPIIYFIIFVTPNLKIKLKKISLVSLAIILFFIGYTYLSYYFQLPFLELIKNFFPFQINNYAGFVGYFSPAITSLFFLIPFLITIIFFEEKNLKLFLLLTMSIIVVILIGRRALILSSVLTVVLCLVIDVFFFKKGKSLRYIIILSILIFISITLSNLFFPDSRIFNIDANLIGEGDIQRKLQFQALISEWKDAPLFGHGFGVNAKSIIRSYTVPGSYELTYIALLFQTGIVGCLLYLCLYSWILYKIFLVAIKKKSVKLVAFLLGIFSIFIANATNPYIQSFDGLWILFYALLEINNETSKKGEVKNL